MIEELFLAATGSSMGLCVFAIAGLTSIRGEVNENAIKSTTSDVLDQDPVKASKFDYDCGTKFERLAI